MKKSRLDLKWIRKHKKTYCVKEKIKTSCTEPSGYMTTKNGKLMFWCTCANCGIKKTRFVKSSGN